MLSKKSAARGVGVCCRFDLASAGVIEVSGLAPHRLAFAVGNAGSAASGCLGVRPCPVLLCKALDLGNINEAQWIVDYILKPLHPLAVWLVSAVMPPLRTLVANMPPTHFDADKVPYGFLVPIYMGIILGIIRMIRWTFSGNR